MSRESPGGWVFIDEKREERKDELNSTEPTNEGNTLGYIGMRRKDSDMIRNEITRAKKNKGQIKRISRKRKENKDNNEGEHTSAEQERMCGDCDTFLLVSDRFDLRVVFSTSKNLGKCVLAKISFR